MADDLPGFTFTAEDGRLYWLNTASGYGLLFVQTETGWERAESLPAAFPEYDGFVFIWNDDLGQWNPAER